MTIADFGSQAVLLRAIATEFPGDEIRAEEGSRDLAAGGDAAVAGVVGAVTNTIGESVTSSEVFGWIDQRGRPGDRFWAVDPIDGTKGFLRGEQFAVAVGLVENGIPVLGVLGCPRLELSGMHGVLVWGGPGIGAFVESLGGGKVRSIAVSGISDPSRARMLGSVESSHGDPELLQRIVEHVGIGGAGCGSTVRQSTPPSPQAWQTFMSDRGIETTGGSACGITPLERPSCRVPVARSPTSTGCFSTSRPETNSRTTVASSSATVRCTHRFSRPWRK